MGQGALCLPVEACVGSGWSCGQSPYCWLCLGLFLGYVSPRYVYVHLWGVSLNVCKCVCLNIIISLSGRERDCVSV